MNHKNLFKNKFAKGLVSLITIIILLSSILAASIFYNDNITANVIKKFNMENVEFFSNNPQIQTVDDIKELNYLNEGWYEIRNGFVFYLDTFTSYVPLWIKVKNLEQQNGILGVEEDGDLRFDESYNVLPQQVVDGEKEETNRNEVTGEVTGLEGVSGFDVASNPQGESSSATSSSSAPPPQPEPKQIYEVLKVEPHQGDKTLFFNKKDGAVCSTRTDTCNSELNKGQSIVCYKNGECETISIRDPNKAVAPSVGKAGVPPRLEPQEIERAKFTTPDKKLIHVIEKGDDIILYVNGNPIGIVPKKLVSDVVWNDPRGFTSFENLPLTNNGFKKIERGEGFYKSTDTFYDKKTGNPTKQKETTVITADTADKGDTTETVIEYNPKDRTIKSSTQTYTDKLTGTKRVIAAKEGQSIVDREGKLDYNNIKSVNFEKDGKRLEVSPDAYRDMVELTQTDEKLAVLFFEEARNRGLTKIDKIELDAGIRYVGNLQGMHVGYVGDGRIIAKNGENVIGYIDRNKGLSVTIEGKAIEDPSKGYILSEGATAFVIQRNAKREIESDKIEQQTKQGLVVGEYKNKDEVVVSIYVDDTPKSTYTFHTEIVSHKDSPFYGMSEIDGPDGKTYYIDRGDTGFGVPFNLFGLGSFFGIGGGQLYEDVGGKPKKVDDKQLNQEFNAVKSNLYADIKRKGGLTPEQLSSQRFFANVERIFTEFQGLGYYATLFFDEDSLLEWRDNVDRMFATLYLGTEYWASDICGQYLDGEDEGIAWAETPQGFAQVAAHIEATRTEPIITPTGQEFIYKITFNVRNGDWDKDPRAPEEMNINVVLKGERIVTVFKKEQRVKRGSSFGRTGRNAIVQDSTVFYNEVCLTFDETPLRWKLSNSEICNLIVESSGAATPISTTTTTTATSGGGSQPESEFNDF